MAVVLTATGAVDVAALLYLNPDLVADRGLTSLHAAAAALPLPDQALRATELPPQPAGFDARVFVAAQTDVSHMNGTIRRAMLAMGLSEAAVERRGTFVATIMEDVAATQAQDGALRLALSSSSPFAFTSGTLNPGDLVRMQVKPLGDELVGRVLAVLDAATCAVDIGQRVLWQPSASGGAPQALQLTLVGIKLYDCERQAAASYARLLIQERASLVAAPDPDDLGPRSDFSLGTYHAVYPETRPLGFQDAYLDYRARWKRNNEYRIIRGRDIFNLAAPYTSNLLPAKTGAGSADLTVHGVLSSAGAAVGGGFLQVSSSNLLVGAACAPSPLLGVAPEGVSAMGGNLLVGPTSVSAFGTALVVGADGTLVAGGAASNLFILGTDASGSSRTARTALGSGALVVESAADGASSTASVTTVGRGALVVSDFSASNATSVGSGALVVVASAADGSSTTAVGTDALVVEVGASQSASTTSLGAGALVVASIARGVNTTSVGAGSLLVSSSNVTTAVGTFLAGGAATDGGFMRVDAATVTIDAGGYLLSATGASAAVGVPASLTALGNSLVVLQDSVALCGKLAVTAAGDVVAGGDASNVALSSSASGSSTHTALGAGTLTVDTGPGGVSTTSVGDGALVVSSFGAQQPPGSGTTSIGGGLVQVGPATLTIDQGGYLLSAQASGAAGPGSPPSLSALGTSLVVLSDTVSACAGQLVVTSAGDVVAGGALSNVVLSCAPATGSTTSSFGAGACVVQTCRATETASVSACGGALSASVAASGGGSGGGGTSLLSTSLCDGALVVTTRVTGGGHSTSTASIGGGAIVVSASNLSPSGTVVTGPLEALDRVGIGMACWGTESEGVDGTNTAATTRLAVDGDVYVTGCVVSLSDERAKADVRPLDRALERVGMMRGYTYAMAPRGAGQDKGGARRHTGLLAQEVARALPEAVFSAPRGEGGDFSSVAYGNVVGLLVQAVNELAERLQAVEATFSPGGAGGASPPADPGQKLDQKCNALF